MYFFIFILCLNTITSMINTNPFFDFYCCRRWKTRCGRWKSTRCVFEKRLNRSGPKKRARLGGGRCWRTPTNGNGTWRNCNGERNRWNGRWTRAKIWCWYVKSVFIVHVGCTRCVTSSTDNIMKIHVRITLNVEFIRTCIFLFLFYV